VLELFGELGELVVNPGVLYGDSRLVDQRFQHFEIFRGVGHTGSVFPHEKQPVKASVHCKGQDRFHLQTSHRA
jgi:hypothetical protein